VIRLDSDPLVPTARKSRIRESEIPRFRVTAGSLTLTGFGNYIFSRPFGSLVRSLTLFQVSHFSGFYQSFIFCEIYQHLRSLTFVLYFLFFILVFIIVIIVISVIFSFICIIRSYITLHQLTIQHYSTIER
jgi:hypothetical protein